MTRERSLDDGAVDLVARVRASRLPPPAERKRIRHEAGVSLRDMAAVLGVTAGTVLRWEQGLTPRLEHALAYRRLLDELDRALQETTNEEPR